MTDGELNWPANYPRTPAVEREPYPGDLSPTRTESFESVVDELERWGATEGSVKIDTASQHYADRPNIPHQHDKPDDVGVVARFRWSDAAADDGRVIACDCWETQRENARAIALWARRQRLAERCGVSLAGEVQETAQLPPGAGDESDAVAVWPEPHEILGVRPDATDAAVKAAYRGLAKETHPDRGGSREQWDRVQNARDAMLGGDRS